METRAAIVGNESICYLCIGSESECPSDSEFKGLCVCCGKEIGIPYGFLRRKKLAAHLTKGSHAICTDCFELGDMSRREMLAERGSIPSNTEFRADQSLPAPRQITSDPFLPISNTKNGSNG